VHTHVTRGALLAGLALGAVTVASAEPSYDRSGAPPDLAGPSPAPSGAAPDPLPFTPAPTGELRWIEGDGLTPPWLCEFVSDCDADYLAFSTLVAEHASLLSADELDASFAAPRPPKAARAGPSELEALVREALGVGFLLDRAETTPLRVNHLARRVEDGARMDWLLVEDLWVGTIPMRVFSPAADDPLRPGARPAILFLTAIRT